MKPETNYTVDVLGQTWEGLDSSYQYFFTHEPTAEEIKARACDFQSIEDYRVTCITVSGTWALETTARTVIRPWQEEDSDTKWAWAMAG